VLLKANILETAGFSSTFHNALAHQCRYLVVAAKQRPSKDDSGASAPNSPRAGAQSPRASPVPGASPRSPKVKTVAPPQVGADGGGFARIPSSGAAGAAAGGGGQAGRGWKGRQPLLVQLPVDRSPGGENTQHSRRARTRFTREFLSLDEKRKHGDDFPSPLSPPRAHFRILRSLKGIFCCRFWAYDAGRSLCGWGGGKVGGGVKLDGALPCQSLHYCHRGWWHCKGHLGQSGREAQPGARMFESRHLHPRFCLPSHRGLLVEQPRSTPNRRIHAGIRN
jgi:hypothetical protein